MVSHRRRWLGPALVMACALAASGLHAADASTVVLLVRHAEKASQTAADPSLSAAGKQRALVLARTVGDAGVAALFHTEFKRTQLTVKPLASRLHLTPIRHQAADTNGLVQDINANWLGKTVMVCGHSNTVPEIITRLTGIAMSDIPDGQYDNLYVVVLPPNGPPSLTHLKYGASTP